MSIDPADYPNLRITGPISAKLVEANAVGETSPLLILGPTGAGKSTFIEALAQDASLRISSNQLEGFTQTVNTYHVKNLTWPSIAGSGGTYLVDVPGFADTGISTTKIISMLKEWMGESGAGNLGRILYLTPIHSVRLPGSHRELLRTFQALTGAKTAGNITIVTTMWDNLWGTRAKTRAESNFNQLGNGVWKDFIREGSQIVKFHNTQESAVSIINTAFRDFVITSFHLEIALGAREQLKSAPFVNYLTSDLQSRIQNLEIEVASIEMDLKGASERGDDLLISTLIPQLKETKTRLAKFQKELYDNFGIIPTPLPDLPSAGDYDGPSNIDTPIVTSQSSEAITTRTPPSSSTHPPAAELETTLQPSLPLQPSNSPPNQPDALVSSIAEPNPQKQTFIARIFRSAKCWGDAVAERHDA